MWCGFVKTHFFIVTEHLLHKVLPNVSRLFHISQKEKVEPTMLRPCVANIVAVKLYKDDNLEEVHATMSSDPTLMSSSHIECLKSSFHTWDTMDILG